MNTAVAKPLSAEDALKKAKIALMQKKDSSFFTTLTFSMRFAWDRKIPTAATDGYTIWINPDSYLLLTPGQRLSRLVHETLHPALLHFARKGDRDHKLWNAAGDFAINGMLVERGFERIPTWLYNSKYSGWSTEKIYDDLKQQCDGGGGGGFQMPEDQLDLLPSPQGKEEQKKLDKHVQDILIRAAVQSKISGDTPGTIPGDIQLLINKLLNPKLPWYQILAKYFQDRAKDDFTWRRPNKRFFPKHYLPSMFSEHIVDLVWMLDISGSVTDKDFIRFVSEVHYVFRTLKPKTMKIVMFDTEIKSEYTIKSVAELAKVKFHGRGGTSIKPVIDWINKNKPDVTLIFTDGGFYYSEELKTKHPLVWLIHNNPEWEAIQGKVIHYEGETEDA